VQWRRHGSNYASTRAAPRGATQSRVPDAADGRKRLSDVMRNNHLARLFQKASFLKKMENVMTKTVRTTLHAGLSTAFLLFAFTVSGLAQAQTADKEYKASMEKMDAAMMKGMDPDPTKAWAKMMVAHHQGAIDMSKTVLKETKDPMIRQMAEKGIKDQGEEQKMLEDWISKH
jgi:hypothetical protein